MERLIGEGFFSDKDLNCAETMLHAANELHGWNLSHEALLLSAGFGGGVGGQELLCGALVGGVMALSKLFVRDRGHESDLIKTIVQEYFSLFKEEMGHTDCTPLKKVYRTETKGCRKVILASARCLDQVVEKHRQEMV